MTQKKIFLLLIISFCFYAAHSQQISSDITQSFVVENLDSLHNSWMTKCCNHQVENKKPIKINKEDLKAAIDDLPGFNLFYTDGVYKLVNLYLNTKRNAFCEALALFDNYKINLNANLVKNKLLPEWQYFPLAASFFYPLATDHQGGYGYWHLNLTQARFYGLTVNSMLDERKDLDKSTKVVIRYIKNMKKLYKDTDLSFMAFLLSPETLNKKIREAQGSKNIADLYKYMNAPQRALYDNFVACYYLSKNAAVLGLQVAKSSKWPIKCDRFVFKSNVSFAAINKMTNIGMDTLKILNPTLRANIALKGIPLLVPEGYGIFISNHLDSIMYIQNYNENQASLIDSDASTQEKNIEARYKQDRPRGKKRIIYTVKSGDVLGQIAEKYHVYAHQIKRWNHLRSSRIYQGQKLNIYTSRPRQSASHQSSAPVKKSYGNKKYIYYKVRKGESLYTIARKFPGISAKNIMSYNGMSSNIHPGQRIKIPVYMMPK